MEFEISGNSVTIVDRRPPCREDFGPEWSRLTVAQLRYEDGKWRSTRATATVGGIPMRRSSTRRVTYQQRDFLGVIRFEEGPRRATEGRDIGNGRSLDR